MPGDIYGDRFRKKRRKLIRKYKAIKGCAHCGFRNPYALQFDHIIPLRRKEHTKLNIDYYQGKCKLKEALSKVQVLCANCHSIKTYEEKDG